MTPGQQIASAWNVIDKDGLAREIDAAVSAAVAADRAGRRLGDAELDAIREQNLPPWNSPIVDALNIPLVRLLRLVAKGLVLPDTIVHFAGSKYLKPACRLPVEEQRRLIDAGEVPTVRTKDGRCRGLVFSDSANSLRLGLVERVKSGTPHDVAEWLFDAVRESEDPHAVVARLQELLAGLPKKRKRVTLSEAV